MSQDRAVFRVAERLRPPCNLVPEDAELFGTSMIGCSTGCDVQILRDVEVLGRGPIRARDGQYLVESFVNEDHYRRWRRERGHWRAATERLFQKLVPFDAPAVWITDNWSCGYFHWFCDALPRLEVALREHPAAELTLLLPAKFGRDDYFLESLAPFKLKEVRILKRFERLRCRELLLPSHISRTGNYDSCVMQSLRERFRGHSERVGGGRVHQRLYISRRLASRRCIDNEKAILPVLADHGFETLVAEQAPWAQQIQLAAAATHLVSNHGAGLTNMMMMATGSSVMEIRERQDRRNNCYFNLANSMGLNYYYLLAPRRDPSEEVHFADLVVDPSTLDAALGQMIADSAQRQSA